MITLRGLITAVSRHRCAAGFATWLDNGVFFRCTQCGKCCTGQSGPVWVAPQESQVLSNALSLGPREFVERYTEDPPPGAEEREGSWRVLKQDPDSGACVFLEGGQRCTVYQNRPIQCRTYPFHESALLSPLDWRAEATRCEGIRLPPARLGSAAVLLEQTHDGLHSSSHDAMGPTGSDMSDSTGGSRGSSKDGSDSSSSSSGGGGGGLDGPSGTTAAAGTAAMEEARKWASTAVSGGAAKLLLVMDGVHRSGEMEGSSYQELAEMLTSLPPEHADEYAHDLISRYDRRVVHQEGPCSAPGADGGDGTGAAADGVLQVIDTFVLPEEGDGDGGGGGAVTATRSLVFAGWPQYQQTTIRLKRQQQQQPAAAAAVSSALPIGSPFASDGAAGGRGWEPAPPNELLFGAHRAMCLALLPLAGDTPEGAAASSGLRDGSSSSSSSRRGTIISGGSSSSSRRNGISSDGSSSSSRGGTISSNGSSSRGGGGGGGGNVAVLGVGGGALPRAIAAALPGVSIDAVELDARVLSLARRYFGLAGESVQSGCWLNGSSGGGGGGGREASGGGQNPVLLDPEPYSPGGRGMEAAAPAASASGKRAMVVVAGSGATGGSGCGGGGGGGGSGGGWREEEDDGRQHIRLVHGDALHFMAGAWGEELEGETEPGTTTGTGGSGGGTTRYDAILIDIAAPPRTRAPSSSSSSCTPTSGSNDGGCQSASADHDGDGVMQAPPPSFLQPGFVRRGLLGRLAPGGVVAVNVPSRRRADAEAAATAIGRVFGQARTRMLLTPGWAVVFAVAQASTEAAVAEAAEAEEGHCTTVTKAAVTAEQEGRRGGGGVGSRHWRQQELLRGAELGPVLDAVEGVGGAWAALVGTEELRRLYVDGGRNDRQQWREPRRQGGVRHGNEHAGHEGRQRWGWF